MTGRSSALYDALDQAWREADDQTVWLKPRSGEKFPSTRAVPPIRMARSGSLRLGRWTAALGVGLLLNLSSAQNAFAPSTAQAAGDLAALEGLGASIAPVLSAPIRITTHDHADPLILGLPELRSTDTAAAEPTDADLARALGDIEGEAGRDSQAILGFGPVKIPRTLVETILRAAEVAGVDPVYMMALADKESSFTPDIKASTSSAEGLFQFITKTWLTVVREYGPKYGLEAEAAAIELEDGDPVVADDATRERILGLRRDPYISAVMAAEMLKADRVKIESRIGRELTRAEFYLTHFLGVDSAMRLVEIMSEKPKQSARRLFPKAARANKTLFFTRKGRKMRDLTVAEVHSKLVAMIDKRLGRYNDVTTVVAEAETGPQL